ncbi:hypothetical protein [Flavobacterium sp. N2820]|uniref:hypothetical protein n=1 Tax=Flavobacterium sp. N2820 TaxID=2986834 RepID=UPI002224C978|nr:hypothetical protein [Flavobacterium sp. N2820]
MAIWSEEKSRIKVEVLLNKKTLIYYSYIKENDKPVEEITSRMLSRLIHFNTIIKGFSEITVYDNFLNEEIFKVNKRPLKELSKIVEKTIIEINKALKIFDLSIKEMQSTNEFDIHYINKLKQDEYNNIISTICKTNNINENHIRKIGGWQLSNYNLPNV